MIQSWNNSKLIFDTENLTEINIQEIYLPCVNRHINTIMNTSISDYVPVTISPNLKKMLEPKLKTESLLLRRSSAQPPQAKQAQYL